MSRLFIKALSLSCCCLLPAVSPAQPVYPQQYFRNPLGIPILLAGNFGECRPGHFHSGIDIKTEGKENLPVYASANGYISRIKMEPGGFGHGLYITHPNGYTTLYAHLNNFMPAIQQYVRREQYARESWTVDLALRPDQFPVKKGDQIAFSGNTGGSTAPHLHFEIRDTQTEHPLNPQLFGFAIKDKQAPVPAQLAVYHAVFSGDQAAVPGLYDITPRLLPLKKKGTSYKPLKDTVFLSNGTNTWTGLGIVANDFMDGSTNTLAFYTAEWLVDDQLQGRIRLDNIGYEETRYVNAYADYRTKQKGGPWIQCLFRLPGNRLGKIYEDLQADRVLADGAPHVVRIVLRDVYGNKSETGFVVKAISDPRMSPPVSPDNCLPVAAGEKKTIGLPVAAGEKKTIGLPGVSLALKEDALYDRICAVIRMTHAEQGYSPRYTIADAAIPVHSYSELHIKPDKFIPFELRDKVALIYNNGKTEDGKAAVAEEKGWYKASVRSFGEYRLAPDTVPPAIKPALPWKEDQRKAKRISFIVKDALTSVRSFRGELDGHWILFEQHENNWFYEMDAHCPKGAHTLTVTATDENGNEATASYRFIR